MGYLAKTGDLSEKNLRRAVIYGSVMASFAVEDFGLGRLLRGLHRYAADVLVVAMALHLLREWLHGHERGFRSGTLPTHQIVGMGEAFRIARLEMATENERIRALRDRLLKGVTEIEEAFVNGDVEQRVPHNLNVSFNFVEGESLIMAVKDIAVSSGSACTSASLEPSYVLRALGRSDELAHSSIRFTLGRFTTAEELDYTVDHLKTKVAKLREMSPLWEMYKDGVDLNTVQWAAH